MRPVYKFKIACHFGLERPFFYDATLRLEYGSSPIASSCSQLSVLTKSAWT